MDTAHSAASDDLTGSLMVSAVLVTSSAASGRVVLSDATTGITKLDLRVAATNGNASGESILYALPDSVMFPNGIKVSTLTTAVASVFVRDTGKAS